MLTIKKVEVFGPNVQGLREPPGGLVGVRSTERSEARKVATPEGGHAQSIDNQYKTLLLFRAHVTLHGVLGRGLIGFEQLEPRGG